MPDSERGSDNRTVRVGFVGGYEPTVPTRLIAYSHATKGEEEHVYVAEAELRELHAKRSNEWAEASTLLADQTATIRRLREALERIASRYEWDASGCPKIARDALNAS